MSKLTLDEASDLVGDDIAYWLNNPFMDRDAMAAKVCYWIAAALAAAAPAHDEGAEVEVRELWAIRWSDGSTSGAMYSDDGSDYAEQVMRTAAGDDAVVHRTETITRTPWTALAPTAAEQVQAARAVADRDAARIAGQVRASGEGREG